ncbi:hypothetical protein KC851_01500 [Candidatus Kaiserbacteria bacterium]|nr:hypothetical protein [Candidatus Kaiserbacteria bacterium]
MKNIIYIGVLLAIIIVVGIFTLNNSNTAEYVVTVDNEITQLENELAELDLAVESGTLTEAQATEAKVKILARLDSINASISSSEKAKLTPAQQKQLSEGLDRLKNILVTYQATLSVIDDKAVETEVVAKTKTRKGGSVKNISSEIVGTIDIVEDNIEEVVEDYVPDEQLDDQIEEIIAEEENETDTDDTSTSTEDTVDDTEDEVTETDDDTTEEASEDADSEDEGVNNNSTSTEDEVDEISETEEEARPVN